MDEPALHARAARPGEDHGADVPAMLEVGEQIPQFRVDLERERVQPVRAVEGDGGNAVLFDVEKILIVHERVP